MTTKIDPGISVFKVEQQSDGRFTIIYRNDEGLMIVQPNAALCFRGTTHEYEGDKFIGVYFEVTEVNVVK